MQSRRVVFGIDPGSSGGYAVAVNCDIVAKAMSFIHSSQEI